MDHFVRRGRELCAEDVPLSAIAERFGTPVYVYSRATLERHARVLFEALSGVPHLVCYAIKANGNLAVLETLANTGCGLDAVSVGELARALKVGVTPERIIVSGVGKRDDEIEAALEAGVLYISIESPAELEAVGDVARRLGVTARVSVRVNPDVDAATHPYISTGLRENKFGVPISTATALYDRGVALGIAMVGVTCHIGSQITQVGPFIDAAERVADLARALLARKVPLAYVGIGGGLGIPYAETDSPPSPAEYGAALAKALKPLGLTVVLEPGRVIVGNAGVLLTRVIRVKDGADRRFVIVDAGMNDLIRPALYEAQHRIETVAAPAARTATVTVVGPVCESSDVFSRDATLPELASGDLLVFRGAGAYGFAMSSNYNARPRPAEVLVQGDKALLVRERESLADLWRGEHGLDGTPYDADLPRGMS